jgi:hypothetical protein
MIMMQLPAATRLITLALSLALLAGCAQFNSDFGYPNRYGGSYSQSDFDELLVFGSGMATMPSTARVKTCRSLLKQQKLSPSPDIYLHLMVGRLLSDACGDISKVLAGVNSIPPRNMPDPRLQRLVTIDTEILKRLNYTPRRHSSQESSQRSESEPDAKSSSGSKKNENRLLREKLDAIRSMEKHLDESEEVK